MNTLEAHTTPVRMCLTAKFFFHVLRRNIRTQKDFAAFIHLTSYKCDVRTPSAT